MAILTRHKWSSAALVAAIGANATQLLAKYHAGVGRMTMARATVERAERERLHHIAFWHAHGSDMWGAISLCLALFAVGCRALARRFHEAGHPGVLVGLLSLYLLLLLLVV